MSLKKKNKIKQTQKQIMAQKVIDCLAVKKIKFAQFENKRRQRKVTFTRAILHCN
jgi:hypothetical protein